MFKKFAFLVSIFLLQGCAGIIFGTTITGAYFIGSFSSVSEVKSEYSLQQKIKNELEAIKKLQDQAKYEIEPLVLNNKIYLIGTAENPSSKGYPMDYISLKYKSRYKIIDEVRILKRSFSQKISDSIIKRKVKTKFVFTNGIRYGNYYIAVYGSEVFIIGIAADKYEAGTVLNLTSSTRGVKKIINYVEVRDIGD